VAIHGYYSREVAMATEILANGQVTGFNFSVELAHGGSALLTGLTR
jgi:hypothetical protein